MIDISTNIELFNELKSSLCIYKEQYESLISFFVSQRELFSYYTQRLSNLLIVLNSLSQSSTDDILSTYQSSLLSSSLSHQTLPQTITAYNTSSISQIKQNIISLYNNFTSLKNALSGLYRNEFVLSSLPDHFSKSKLILKQKDTEAKNKILEDKSVKDSLKINTDTFVDFDIGIDFHLYNLAVFDIHFVDSNCVFPNAYKS